MLRSDDAYHLPQELEGTILAGIVQTKAREIVGARKKWPLPAIRNALEHAGEVRSLRRALARHSPAIIAEIKRASPSAGLLRADFDPLRIADEYERSGAAAISVVTEGTYFRGSLEILAALRWNTRIPLLRKDFIIDAYQIFEARHANADSILLIAALLGTAELRRLREETESLGMEALVEVHDEAELERALEAGAGLIGVNNRNLRTFEVSLDVSLKLAPLLPKEVLAVAESGLHTAEDIRRLADCGYRGFLVGEQLLRSASPGEALKALLSPCLPGSAS
jgi:indole-3-glycerol phosphate synthase